MMGFEFRYFGKVRRGKPNQCWPWVGAKSSGSIGYGTIKRNGKSVYVHRVAYELANSVQLTPADCVLHTCDCPHCCNPAHLAKGTKGDNNRDRTAKLRTHSKLHPGQVIAIVVQRKAGSSAKQLASDYGVSPSTIYSICRGKTWGHLTGLGPSVELLAARPIKTPPRRRSAKHRDMPQRHGGHSTVYASAA